MGDSMVEIARCQHQTVRVYKTVFSPHNMYSTMYNNIDNIALLVLVSIYISPTQGNRVGLSIWICIVEVRSITYPSFMGDGPYKWFRKVYI